MSPARTSVIPAIRLDSDLFLASNGRFHRTPPPGVEVVEAGGALGLTEATKAALIQTTLSGLTNQGGNLKPLNGDTPGMSIVDIANDLKIPVQIQDLVGTALNIATAVGVAIAAYEFVVSFLEWQGVLKKEDVVKDIATRTNQIYATTISGLWGQRRVEIANWRTKIVGTGDALLSYMELPNEARRDLLDDREKDASDAVTAILDQAYQEIPYFPAEHNQKEWVFGIGWLEVPATVVAQLQPYSPRIKRMVDMQAGETRWDYRLFLGDLLYFITVRLAQMRALNPDFRSTGRYKPEMARIYAGILKVQDQWLQSIQRTRDIDDLRDFTQMIGWPSAWLPVGAVDICTGLPAMYGRWNDFVYKPGLTPSTRVAGLELASRIDWPATMSKAHSLRDQFYLALLTQTGYINYRRWVASMKVLTQDPDESETVTFKVGSTVFRPTLRPPEPVARTVEGVVGCTAQEFIAEVRRSSPGKRIQITTQKPHSKAFFEYLYRYYLLTPSSVQVEVTPGAGTATLTLQTHDVETSPSGRRRVVKGPSLPIDFEWQMDQAPGLTTIVLRCKTPDVNTDGLTLIVEERIASGAVLKSRRGIEIVQRILRLPEAYFDKLDACEDTANRIFGGVNERFAISESLVRIPSFDPSMYTRDEYLRDLATRFPDVMEEVIHDVTENPRFAAREQFWAQQHRRRIR